MIEVGILKNFDSGTYKAGVQLAGSLTTYFDDISVAKNIPSGAMVTGNYVIVAIPGGNPRDACVIATWPQGTPGGGGAGTFLDLSDTPSSYSGQAGKGLKVNDGQDALEFVARGWELIDDHYFSAQATDYTISGLNGNLDEIYMFFVFLVRNVASNYGIVMRPNNDSGANYRQQTISAYGTTVAASHYKGASLTGISVAFIRSDGDASWNSGQYLYAPTGHFRQCHGYRHYDYSAIVGSPLWDSRLSAWENSADNITSLVFAAEIANGFGVGSRIALFRMAR